MMLGHISTLVELIMDDKEHTGRMQFRESVYRRIEKTIRDYCQL